MTKKSRVNWLNEEIKELRKEIKDILKKDADYILQNITYINLLRQKIKTKEFKIKNISNGLPDLGYWDNGKPRSLYANKVEIIDEDGL